VKVFEHGQSYKEIMPNIKRILMYSVSFIFIYYAYYACAKRNEDFSMVVFLNKDQASIPAIKLHGQPVMEIDSFYEGHL
jgi:capsule polysaccharide export protein KpsE/RkpR